MVPKSRDVLSVYNGKGLRPVDAQVGALMEAIERQTAIKTRLPYIEGSFSDLDQRLNVLDPNRVNQRLAEDYSEHYESTPWVEGLENISGEGMLGSRQNLQDIYGTMFRTRSRASKRNDTNGRASGNCREEAICHALCELAERDAWTMAELGAHQLPRQRRSLAFGINAGRWARRFRDVS